MKNFKVKLFTLGIISLFCLSNIMVFLPFDNLQFNQSIKTSAGEINIITPENKSYTAPMNGYYSGSYGFENDENGVFPEEWSEEGFGSFQNRVYVVDSKDGHNKVMYLNDPGGTIHLYPAQIFDEQVTSGTVEFWIYYNSHNFHTHIFI